MGPRRPAIWLLACGFLLAAPLAHAQSTEIGTNFVRNRAAGGGRESNELNKVECVRNDTFTFDVTPSTTGSLDDYALEVWAGSGCKEKDARITSQSCRLLE